jgi:hypothetical protein
LLPWASVHPLIQVKHFFYACQALFFCDLACRKRVREKRFARTYLQFEQQMALMITDRKVE